MKQIVHDVRHTLRGLSDAPIYTVTVALTLALGLGANTALFSAAEALLLRPLPFENADRLVAAHAVHAQRGRSLVSLMDLADWREQSQSLSSLAGYRFRTFALDRLGDAGAESPKVIRTAMATSELSRVLGVELLAGRFFSAEEETTEAAVVVLGEALWRQHFGASTKIVGRSIRLNEVPHTVLGIAPDLAFPAPGLSPEAYIPISHRDYGQRRSVRSLNAIGRLKVGVSRDEASTEVRTIASRLAEAYPESLAGWSVELEDLHEALYGGNRRPLQLLLSAGSLLLLIACSNVAHLLVARFLAGRRKVAVRLALGARHGQLARLFFVEGALLSLLGAFLGLWVARFCLSGLPTVIKLLGGNPPAAGTELGFHWPVLLFVIVLASMTTIFFGLVPALLARRTDVQRMLKGGAAENDRRGFGRGLLVVGQIAFSMVLLLAAGLLLRSFQAVVSSERGFDSAGVQRFGIGLPEARYDEQRMVEFHGRLLEGLASIDGVLAAGAAARVPAGARLFTTRFSIEGLPVPEEPWRAAINVVSDGFFSALRIPRLAGRGFETSDGPDAVRVVLVNQAFREAYLEPEKLESEKPELENALGTRLQLSWASALHPRGSPWEIVGVVGDTRLRSLEERAEPAIYLALTQFPVEGGTYLLRTERGDADFHAAVREAVAALDPDLVPPVVGSLEETVRRGLADRRLALLLVGAFAALGLILTAIGIYGLMSYSASQRRREMAIRLAMGARRGQISELLLGQGLRLALTGAVLGLAVFAYVSRWIESQLYETRTLDPATVLSVMILVCAAALLACAVPSRRLSRVSPSSLLRSE